MKNRGLLLALLLALVVGAHALHSLRDGGSKAKLKGWHAISSGVDGETPLEFLVALPHQNVELIHDVLMSVSDPRSPTYGQHLSKAETEALFAPSLPNVELVTAFFEKASCEVEKKAAGAYLKTRCSVTTIERLFSVSLSVFEHESIDVVNDPLHHMDRIIRTHDPLSIPEGVANSIEFIHGINDFPHLNRKKQVAGPLKDPLTVSVIPGSTSMLVEADVDSSLYSEVTISANGLSVTESLPPANGTYVTVSHVFTGLANYQNVSVSVSAAGSTNSTTIQYGSTVFPSDWITSELVHRLYSIPRGTVGTNSSNSQAVVEFDRQYYSSTDLSNFSYLMGLPNPSVTVVGPNNESHPGGESTLDIEWVTAVGVGVPTEFWSMESGFLEGWVMSLLDSDAPPLVNSISYGIAEAGLPLALMTRLNNQFAILGQRGVTIISTSGDLGSSDGTTDCVADEPDYPSSSPYTTSLGASYVYTATDTPFCQPGSQIFGMDVQCDATAELPCAAEAGTGFTTGGGFSAAFDRPSWQDQAVTQYLNTAQLPPSWYFNSDGRGFNDVGALGYNIVVVLRGETSISGGTSASGPIFAGLVGLLNDARLNNNKSPLGFMNPFLYNAAINYPGAFNQVLSGDNRCKEVGTNGVLEPCCEFGFEAQAGWNPLTGLGTPNFEALRDIAIELP